MKISIIGDLHYGASYKAGITHPKLHVNTRLLDYHETLMTTIDRVVADGVRVLVFTGDIFEHRRPTLVQQKFFSKALAYAFSLGIEVIYIVIGNHDQQRASKTNTLSYLQELKLNNLHIIDELDSVILSQDGEIYANLIFMPYRDRKWYGVDTYDEARACLQKELDFQLKSIENNRPKILVGHMTIEGTLVSEGYLDLNYENQLYLPKEMFSNIDITLMGHIHEPGVISQTPYIAYVGSMEKRSGTEINDKVYCIVDLARAKVEFYPEPCRNIFDINLDFAHLSLGANLHETVYKSIGDVNDKTSLEDSILKVTLRISSGDEQYCDLKRLISDIEKIYKVHNCLDILPNVFSPRQARDDRITEAVSDLEAFQYFIGNTIDDVELRKEVLTFGIDIMKHVQGEHNAAS